jgi:hypothetical protein
VGDIAIELYGGDQGTFIEYNGGNFTVALAKTEQLMTSMFRTPVFEATLQHGGVLVREKEFRGKFLQGDRFVSRIVSEPKTYLLGTSDDLGKLVRGREP